MSILYIALQCFQCSTMQVKQQKKSSNKWTCVICNEKQSVRKIHARGYQAKDLRKFVQSVNSSRSDGSGWIASGSEKIDGGSDAGRPKRMDWTEYLDPPQEKEEEEELEREKFVIPEMPSEIFQEISKKRPMQKERAGSAKLQRTGVRQRVCKWSKYLDDDCYGSTVSGDIGVVEDLGVEEEVHPDFR